MAYMRSLGIPKKQPVKQTILSAPDEISPRAMVWYWDDGLDDDDSDWDIEGVL